MQRPRVVAQPGLRRVANVADCPARSRVGFGLLIFAEYRENLGLAGLALPTNGRKYRKLDCAVFEYAYEVIKASGQNASVDTARGVYVPTGGERRVWEGSWLSRDTHIQLCVRNPANISCVAPLSDGSGGQ